MSPRPPLAGPYPGLRPFQKHEWPIFFGREPMIDAVLDRLAATRLVVVHGSSGCGKSSLIKAGVLPRLEQEHSRYGVPWHTAELRPGSSPLWNIASAIARLHGKLEGDAEPTLHTTRTVRRLLNGGRDALARIQKRFDLGLDGNVCLLLDQFEELFRYAREIGREEAETLVEVLRGFELAAEDGRQGPPEGIYAILTMRSDHLGDCGHFEGFAELINGTQYLLPRMSDEALLRAIREPARLVGGDVAPDLAVRLVDESHAEIDALPLVQHALMRMWRRAAGATDEVSRAPSNPGAPHPVLTAAVYVRLEPLLSEHAEEVLAEVEAAHPGSGKVTEYLFRALTEIDVQGRGVRRPRRLSELIGVTGGDPAALERVVDRFAQPDCGFLTRSSDEDPMIDIGHEALIRCWKKLDDPTLDEASRRPRGWLQREREDARIWRSMLVQAEAGDPISPAVLKERERWFASLPSPAWAERYGGGWKEIAKLLKLSQNAARRKRLVQVGAAIFVPIFAAVFGGWWTTGISLKDSLTILGLKLRFINPIPEMVLLKEGTFVMGSTELTSQERPAHTAKIVSFEISKYEVTFEDWHYCVLGGGCEGYQPYDAGWGRGRRPVINVSWKDAKKYVKWLSDATGEDYHLPSEAEWEYAARAGTTTEYFWGKKITPENANYDNADGTTEVGSYPANPWGLYDMNGNVSEWVEDCWNDSYEGAPDDGSAWESGNCARRVLRGGAWMSLPGKLLSAHRGFYDAENRQYAFGFRVARTLSRTTSGSP